MASHGWDRCCLCSVLILDVEFRVTEGTYFRNVNGVLGTWALWGQGLGSESSPVGNRHSLGRELQLLLL